MSLIAQFRYRPEIDGLRAFAVMAVVLFHADLCVPGGFIGVDIFFVISGYLITALIFKDLQEERFSILEFYERRARRILPAGVVMVFATAVAGWFLLLPSDLAAFGKSATSQVVFAANLYFWRNTNYFSGAADEKPLLHTWSLAVEEQFYMVVPCVLLLLWQMRLCRDRRAALIILSGTCAFSLVLSVALLSKAPSATFYLLPTRAWELLAGSIIALIPPTEFLSRRSVRETMASTGLMAMLLPCALYTKDTGFPGATAVPPVLGAALFIVGCTPTPVANLPIAATLFTLKPVVFIGLISYSLYLWHWPIFAYSNYWALESLTLNQRLMAVAISFVLAYISWRWVETPFRGRSLGRSQKAMFAWSAAGMVGCASIAGFFSWTSGFPSRLPERLYAYDIAKQEGSQRLSIAEPISLEKAESAQFPKLGAHGSNRVELIVWGDSHSRAILPGLDKLAKQYDVAVISAWNSSTPPLLNYVPRGKFSQGRDAPAINNAILHTIIESEIPRVLLAARWQEYFSQEPEGTSLKETISALAEKGCRIWILMEVPNHRENVPKVLSHQFLFGGRMSAYASSLDAFIAQNSGLNDLASFFDSKGVTVLNPKNILWDSQAGHFKMESDGRVLYYDTQHLTRDGAEMLAPLFQSIFADE